MRNDRGFAWGCGSVILNVIFFFAIPFISNPPKEGAAAIIFTCLQVLWVLFPYIVFFLALIGKKRSKSEIKARKLCNIGAVMGLFEGGAILFFGIGALWGDVFLLPAPAVELLMFVDTILIVGYLLIAYLSGRLLWFRKVGEKPHETRVAQNVCARCSVDLCLVPLRKIEKIGGETYCDICAAKVRKSALPASKPVVVPPPKKPAVPRAKPFFNCVRRKMSAPHDQAVQSGDVLLCGAKTRLQQRRRELGQRLVQDLVQVQKIMSSCACMDCKKPVEWSRAIFVKDNSYCAECFNIRIKKTELAERLAKTLAQVRELKATSEVCFACGRRFAMENLIFTEDQYHCRDCLGVSGYEDDWTISLPETTICQISYKIGGLLDASLRNSIVQVADRLIAGGFQFHRAGLTEDVNEINHGDAVSDSAWYTEFDAFKNDAERAASAVYCARAFLSRKSLKIYLLAEGDFIILRWIDESEKAFAAVRVFIDKVLENVYDNKGTLTKIENQELSSEFLSNWN